MVDVRPRAGAKTRVQRWAETAVLLVPMSLMTMTVAHSQASPAQASPAQASPDQAPGTAASLLPQPKQVRQDNGSLPITSSFTVSSNASANPDLQAAVRHMLEAVERQTNTPLGKSLAAPGATATLTIQVADTGASRPTLQTDESYVLDVTGSSVRLTAATVFGAMHGLVTLQQLVQAQGASFILPAVHIDDAPRFAWRGLMIDVSRHFEPLPVLYRTLDGMAEVKLNVLHLHLSDDQGFRLESKRFPQLTAKGSDGLFYTQAQMSALIEYARARGIRIVPEFDVPGHVTSWLVGLPQFASVDRKYEISRTFGVWDAALDPTKDATYKFLDELIGEMAALFPDEYLHMGGDESNGADWKSNPKIVQYMQQHNIASTDALQAYFSARVLELVKKHGKQMIGWDEILQPNTPKDAVIQSWRGVESLSVAAKQGNRGILSAPYYLDGMKTSERMYLDDPLPAAGTLTPAQEKLILGGEVAMWAEQITPQTIDSRIWPRTAALAERFWSPQQTRDVDSLYRRLAPESIRLEAEGLTHISGPNAGLRQIAGSETGAQQLGVLTSTLSPVSFGERYHQQKTSQLTPMGNMVDYTRPDPPLRWHLHTLVETYLHGSPQQHVAARDEMAALFGSWIQSAPAIDAIAAQHPLVNEVALRRQQLPRLGRLGLDAMTAFETKQKPAGGWHDTQAALLKQAGDHSELVDFVILPPLQQLIDAAAQQ